MSIIKAQKQNLLKNIYREVRILKRMNHPNIVKLYEIFRYDMVKTEKFVYLILEYVSGGELYNVLEREGKFDENRARMIFSQIMEGVKYFHSKKISHRDLKLENILVGDFDRPKISDFGLSNYMKDGEFLKTNCGSANYAAPEVISHTRYSGSEADVWSLGVILFVINSGYLPFDEPSLPLLYSKIKNCKYKIPYHFSSNLSHLIESCLQVNPIQRITVQEIIQHPWLNEIRLIFMTSSKYSKPVIINDRIFNFLLEKETFTHLVNKKESLKEKILKKKGFDLFTTSYELLLDSKEYDQNAYDLKIRGLNCKFPFKASERPDDWHIALWVNISPEEIIETLFPALIELGFEWRIDEKFRIKVRSIGLEEKIRVVGMDNASGIKKDLKFEIQVYKENESFALDFRIIFGHQLIFFDVFDKIRKAFVRLSGGAL